MENVKIVLNGTWLKVKKVEFKKSSIGDEEYFHDCYVTFLDGKIERYDAQDVTIVDEEEQKI